MLIDLKFENIGRNKANFTKMNYTSKSDDYIDIDYDFLYNSVKPYILSNDIDFYLDKKNPNIIKVFAGFYCAGKIKIIRKK